MRQKHRLDGEGDTERGEGARACSVDAPNHNSTVNPPPGDFTFSSYATVKFAAIFPKETHSFSNRQFFHVHWLSDGKELIIVLFKIFTQTDAKSNTTSRLREGRKAWKSLILKGKAWHK